MLKEVHEIAEHYGSRCDVKKMSYISKWASVHQQGKPSSGPDAWFVQVMPVTFSVITPSYNSEQYIAEAIQSVVSQRGDFYIKYLVVDGGSTDDTVSILEKYKEICASGCLCNCLGVDYRYITEPDDGMYDALVKGMREMEQGDICSYIASDDFYLPNAFSTVLSVLSGNVSWVTGVPSIFNRAGAVKTSNEPCIFKAGHIRKGIYGTLLPHIQQESTFWKRELNAQLDLDRLRQYKYAGDYYIWHTFAEKYELHTVDAQLAGFRVHEANKSHDRYAYDREFRTISTGSVSVLDYLSVLLCKYAFMALGNGALKYYPKIIKAR